MEAMAMDFPMGVATAATEASTSVVMVDGGAEGLQNERAKA